MTAPQGPEMPLRRGTFAIGMAILFAISMPAAAFAQATTTAVTSIDTIQDTNDGVAATVRSYFADTPVMIAIAKCESEFRQFDENGGPLHGGNGNMIGVYQISEAVHADIAATLGMDIYSLSGNLAYAKHLYLEKGTVPWNASRACWGPKARTLSQVIAATSNISFHPSLKPGIVSPEVVALQKLLNNAGFLIAEDGPGSPGQETPIFGEMTKLALQRFQCEKDIVCNGSASTTGYGAVGPATRAALAMK